MPTINERELVRSRITALRRHRCIVPLRPSALELSTLLIEADASGEPVTADGLTVAWAEQSGAWPTSQAAA